MNLSQSLQELIHSPTAIVILIFLLGMYPLGTTGIWIRKGVETQKSLNKIRVDAENRGQRVNEKWHEGNRKATFYIWGPIIGWTIGYILIFIFTSPLVFFFSLLGLIIPVFGYHGRRFWLTAE